MIVVKIVFQLILIALFFTVLNNSSQRSDLVLPAIIGLLSVVSLLMLKVALKRVMLSVILLGMLSGVLYWNVLEQQVVRYRLNHDRMYMRERVSMQMFNDGELNISLPTQTKKNLNNSQIRQTLRHVELQIDEKTGILLRNNVARNEWIQSYLSEFHESPGVVRAFQRTIKHPYFLVGLSLYLFVFVVLTKITGKFKKA